MGDLFYTVAAYCSVLQNIIESKHKVLGNSFELGKFRMTKPQQNCSAKINTPSDPSLSCPHQQLSHALLISLASVFISFPVSR